MVTSSTVEPISNDKSMIVFASLSPAAILRKHLRLFNVVGEELFWSKRFMTALCILDAAVPEEACEETESTEMGNFLTCCDTNDCCRYYQQISLV